MLSALSLRVVCDRLNEFKQYKTVYVELAFTCPMLQHFSSFSMYSIRKNITLDGYLDAHNHFRIFMMMYGPKYIYIVKIGAIEQTRGSLRSQ